MELTIPNKRKKIAPKKENMKKKTDKEELGGLEIVSHFPQRTLTQTTHYTNGEFRCEFCHIDEHGNKPIINIDHVDNDLPF